MDTPDEWANKKHLTELEKADARLLSGSMPTGEHNITLKGNNSARSDQRLPPFAIAQYQQANWPLRFENFKFQLFARLRNLVLREQELGSFFNLLPVFLSIGISLYFTAPAEPEFIMLALSFGLIAIVLMKMINRGRGFHFLLTVFMIFAGMLAAKVQVDNAVMPVPLMGLTGNISGKILQVDQNLKGSPRYLIEPTKIDSLLPTELPKRIRISAAKKHARFKIGQTIKGLARLSPISGPAYPGGYDFGFAKWIEGLGMSGFFMGAPQLQKDLVAAKQPFNLNALINTIRAGIARRIRSNLPNEAGDIAVALITGDRSGLSATTNNSLRRSGLAHILAISGLHMALVTLTIIWLIRITLSLIPGLSNQYPIKKWAIGAGFLAASFYLLLSGAGIATQRAWVMISVMLAASLLDRQAITMRSVAIAALVILGLSPASLFQPGFQMSFSAVAALVATYRWVNDYNRKRLQHRFYKEPNFLVKLVTYFSGLSLTSLIAGSATAIFALWHFHRVAPLGIMSNLLAMPLVTIIIMPLAMFAVLLMPYGWESLALTPLRYGINAVLKISDFVNSYKLDFETGHQPLSVLIAGALTLVLLSCFQTRLRLLLIAPVMFLVIKLGPPDKLPDILISQNGRAIAVNSNLLKDNQTASGLSLLYPRREKFITNIWQRAYLPNRAFDVLPEQSKCEKAYCNLELGAKKLSVIYDPKRIKPACNWADIIVAPRLWWVSCADNPNVTILKRGDLERFGSHAIFINSNQVNVKNSLSLGVNHDNHRPWQQRLDLLPRLYPENQPIKR